MTIFILDYDVQKCAQMLDDKSLDKQIKAISQVLCSVHHIVVERIELGLDTGTIYEIPLPYKKYKSFEATAQFRDWAYECLANYKYLVKLGLVCFSEYRCRGLINKDVYDSVYEYEYILEWARDNVPDLPSCEWCDGNGYTVEQVGYETDGSAILDQRECDCVPAKFPLVVPAKYKIWTWNGALIDLNQTYDITSSYRNYYAAKIKNPVWTRREKPEFLKNNY